ncbi:MAG: branched-chain amino acid ABC transporter permease [Chloroflexi bacterium]|nr:branched-chain amino acid ABC transporter permease [Chloroflexota bacterium]
MELSVYHTGILISMGINILLGLSVYVMLSTGQLSLGSAGFKAIGAYTASVLTVVLKWDLNLALVAAALVACLAGVIVAFPALRLRGIYLALATLAFGEIVRAFFENLQNTGGAVGYRGMQGVDLLVTYCWVTLFLFLFWRLYSSRLGRAFRAVEQDETVADAMGLNITLIKVTAFAMSGFVGGLAGGIYAHYTMYIQPLHFLVTESLFVVLIVILGGMQTFWGVVLGSAIFAVLPEALRFLKDWRMAAYGLIFALVLIFRPSGLLTTDTLDFLLRRSAKPKVAPETEASTAAQL